ncbi:hypothetical protein [Methylorubrum extorquens]|uniref:hypothetical protein n=1 Tax=Methylorubrum extorquens TaxID=408 RepID=UPI0018C88739|nr:hypothetical protein [Methylorubrum extorquens]
MASFAVASRWKIATRLITGTCTRRSNTSPSIVRVSMRSSTVVSVLSSFQALPTSRAKEALQIAPERVPVRIKA